ncbi:MAG: hypothetical protein ACFCUH_08140 [Flavobacteriales bacterium]
MKTTRFLSILTAGSLALGAITLNSCSKQAGYAGPGPEVNRKEKAKEFMESLIERMPDIGVYNEKLDQVVVLNPGSREFSFATPNEGWNFSSSTGTQFVPYEEGGGILILSAAAFGGNSSGGTVVAGSTALDITYTFCVSASSEAIGLDLFDYGGDFTGVSLVLGIAGDFEALVDGAVDEDSDFNDFFQGLAMYVVYDNEAQGSYDILNWIEDLDTDVDDLAGQGFSYVIDFVDFNLYFSANGELNVSGGEISFTGEYLGFFELLDSIEDEEELEFDLVPGFGAMGCN